MNRKHDEKYRQLGLNIAYYRRKLGYSQDVLAELANISRTYLSNIETTASDKSPSLDTLFDLADALEIDVVKLFEIR